MGFPESLDPTSPAGLDSPRLGDDQIRALKQFLADLFGVVVSPTTIAAACGSIASTGKFTITSGAWNGDAIPVAYGGTNLTSYTIGDIIYASGATTLSKLADVAAGNVVLSGGVGVAPSYGKVDLTAHIVGLLPTANGGTGNGFTKFSGPATSEKTFTLPNASDTIATVGVANIFTVAQTISVDGVTSVPSHFVIKGATDSNRQLIVGYNTTSDYGAIQSIHQGISGTPLALQLAGGNVGLGTASPTAKLHVVGLSIYANNAAAVAGGLTAGAFYRTGADPDPVCVVH